MSAVYDTLAVIRPPRAEYEPEALGPAEFSYAGAEALEPPAPQASNYFSLILSKPKDARRRSTIKLLYGPGIAFPGLARLRDIEVDIVHMMTLNLPELVPSTGTRSGDLRPN
ncbi:hypothetical protein EMIHUDRAFT_225617 [Emiliania huxleyi CCMP1516]|uniref:Uncharacterized protein n=2 Tax=Emiliania huxleyi TaxID=2903 RepID=A0A0D3KNU6_EMIH1|nr:hypothetical protein EMIHUDRAFT_225617 [Emiliania huxleyi CCMP1516]EOD37431.1 hypothetical protein EMIHUDRAFT_225617 [Emiliania huxleyi CCMP1516]|eukprot:XP_005789860.1 hypothetical protein EMIHUDRAFT_225617 [Emiliania huxleyi CCMP1516]